MSVYDNPDYQMDALYSLQRVYLALESHGYIVLSILGTQGLEQLKEDIVLFIQYQRYRMAGLMEDDMVDIYIRYIIHEEPVITRCPLQLRQWVTRLHVHSLMHRD